MLKKIFIKKIKEKLEKEKTLIENSLKSFATKDKKPPGDWDVRFPKFNGGNLEESADEVEEYENLLPIEFSLENRLKDINLALEKIKKAAKGESLKANFAKGEPRQGRGTYGKCEKCQKEIPKERLKVYPAAKTCNKCKL